MLLVVMTHAKLPWVNNGGDAGVTAFFVLSGFLITTILTNRSDSLQMTDIAAFYRRRVVRLGPALLGLLAFTLLFGVVIGWPSHWQLGILSTLVYVSNWAQTAGVLIHPLGHTWSLAIEEQFYLVWPILLLVFRRHIVLIGVLGVVVGSIARTVATGEWEYFSTVSRADAILVGCVLAVRRPSWHPAVAALGVAALVGTALMNPSHDIAIPAAMIATVAVIGGRLEALGVLAPIGVRAYSLYLWNWPMTVLFGGLGLVAPIMTFVAGELSFRCLEVPVLGRRQSVAASSNADRALGTPRLGRLGALPVRSWSRGSSS